MGKLKSEIRSFVEYCKENRMVWIPFVVVFLIFSYRLWNYSIGIDTELAISDYESKINWAMGCGRFFSAFLNRVLMPWRFNYYLSIVYEIIGLELVCFGYLFILYKNGMRKVAELVLFGTLLFTYPTLAELFYFTNAGFNNAIGWFFAVIATYMLSEWVMKREKVAYLIVGIICGACGIGAYQSCLYLMIAGLVLVILIDIMDENSVYTFKIIVEQALRVVVAIMGAVICYLVVSKVCINLFYDVNLPCMGYTDANAYISGQVTWDFSNLSANVSKILTYVKKTMSISVFGTMLVPIALAYLVLCVLARGVKNLGWKPVYTIFLLGALYICSYLGCFVKGKGLGAREQTVLPFVLAAGVILALHFWSGKNMVRKFIIAVVILLSLKSTIITYMLLCTDYARYKSDYEMSQAIYTEICEQYGDIEDKKVVFVSYRGWKKPSWGIKGEIIGKSFYAYDTDTPWGVNYRVHGFWDCHGMQYMQPELEDIYEAKENADMMAIWPAENSIMLYDDVIVVKLLDDY